MKTRFTNVLCRFLSSALEYEAGQVPQDVLLRVTPELIIKYFKECRFENYVDGADLQNGMNFSIKLLANILYYLRKCISHFILM